MNGISCYDFHIAWLIGNSGLCPDCLPFSIDEGSCNFDMQYRLIQINTIFFGIACPSYNERCVLGRHTCMYVDEVDWIVMSKRKNGTTRQDRILTYSPWVRWLNGFAQVTLGFVINRLIWEIHCVINSRLLFSGSSNRNQEIFVHFVGI